jgi:uncharacterized membrane protein
MIPFAADISFRGRDRRRWNLWIPLAVVWLLLLPLVILLLPVFFIACLVCDVEPARAIAALWRILNSLDDTEISVNKPESSFSLHLY